MMMPQASQELRDEWEDDGAAWEFLKDHGWAEINFRLVPGSDHPTEKEWRAAYYLCDEWDWSI
jgi:hypothetical protein